MSGMVIKVGEERLPSRGCYSLNLRDIASQAEAMLDAARAQAATMVAQARKEAETQAEVARQTAHRQGLEKGLAEGRAAGEAAALAEARARFAADQASLVSSLTEMLAGLSARREQLYLAARRDVIVLAVAVAKRISTKLDMIPGMPSAAATQACAEALDLLREATAVAVRAHPEDRAAIERLAETLTDYTQASRHVRIMEDASVGRGGVVVETEASTVDATLATRVDRIADELIAGWRERMKELSIES